MWLWDPRGDGDGGSCVQVLGWGAGKKEVFLFRYWKLQCGSSVLFPHDTPCRYPPS